MNKLLNPRNPNRPVKITMIHEVDLSGERPRYRCIKNKGGRAANSWCVIPEGDDLYTAAKDLEIGAEKVFKYRYYTIVALARRTA